MEMRIMDSVIWVFVGVPVVLFIVLLAIVNVATHWMDPVGYWIINWFLASFILFFGRGIIKERRTRRLNREAD